MANVISYKSGTDTVVTTANKLDGLNDEFYKIYSEFYSLIESEIMSCWKGEDCDAFRQRSNEVKPRFEDMHEVITQYAAFLRKTAFEHALRMQQSRDSSKKIEF